MSSIKFSITPPSDPAVELRLYAVEEVEQPHFGTSFVSIYNKITFSALEAHFSYMFYYLHHNIVTTVV